MRISPLVPLASLAVGLALVSSPPARAEHFDIMLRVTSSQGRAESSWDTAPPEGGLNRRQAVSAAAGEELLLEWQVRSEFPHGVMKNVVTRIFVVPEKEIGQREVPQENTPRVLDNSFTNTFQPHHIARGHLRFRVTQPGSYLVRLESEGTLKEHGHEHFGAVDLKVE
jgi:hypothetical protein